LQGNIDSLSSSTAESLADEVTARGNADTTLQNNIDALSSSTAETDTSLSTAIGNETTARTNADTTLQSNIDALSSSTAETDSDLSDRIENLEQGGNLGELSSSVSELETDLAQEITDRTNADTALQSNIDALSSSTAESLSDEETARANADTALQNNINALSSSTAESLADEVTARGNADTTLQNNIDALSSSTAETEAALSSSTAAVDSKVDALKIIDLTDVDTYVGHGGELPIVKDTEDGIEYVTMYDISTNTISPTAQVDQQFVATAGQTEFQLNYVPSREETVEFFVGPDRQLWGASKDYTINMNTGVVTWTDRSYTLQVGDEILIRYKRGTEAGHSELNGIIRTFQEEPVGATNGSNKVFTLAETPTSDSTVVLFKNSTLQIQTTDYTISGKIITMVTAPGSSDTLMAQYDKFNSVTTKVQETCGGTPDGTLVDFTISEIPVTYGGLMVYLNGVFQTQGTGNDYTVLGKTISFASAPSTGASVYAIYEKNSSNLVIGVVDGSIINNISDAHLAIEELIDQREYEENTNHRCAGHSQSSTAYQYFPVQFSTQKRVSPTITMSTSASANLNTVISSGVTIDGFSIGIKQSANGVVDWRGAWSAQCASITKVYDITEVDFKCVTGKMIFDELGHKIGYDTIVHTVLLSDVIRDVVLDEDEVTVLETLPSYSVIVAGVKIIFPIDNEEQKISWIYGLDSDHLAAQSLKLVKKLMTTEEYETIQSALRSNPFNKAEIRSTFLKYHLEVSSIPAEERDTLEAFVFANKDLMLTRIDAGEKYLQGTEGQ